MTSRFETAMRLAALSGLMFVSLMIPAFGFETDAPLEDPALEARAIALAKELRCLVCQNQSIIESDAPLAQDLRQIVRERIAAGESDDAVKDYVVERYGDFVLLRPPFKPKTLVLWFGPALIIGLGIVGLVVSWRRRSTAATAFTPLTSHEQARLQRLLGDEPDA